MRRGGAGYRFLGAGALALLALLAAEPCPAAEDAAGSMLSDSLLMPTESFVLTRRDIANYNLHTLDDVLGLVPGLSWWREGPAAAYSGFSIEGRTGRGVNLFVNGQPVVDPYRLEALKRFLPLSRLERVEVLYSGSPLFTGDLSSRGAVNLVIEEGGREAPTSLLNFTYGKAKRRARRAWFATPRAHIAGVLVYDEYLQDGVECIPALPGRIIGKYDSRSILGELIFNTAAGENVLLRFQRYEDTSIGTVVSSTEDVRWSGFSSLVSYRRSGLDVSIRQRALRLYRAYQELNAFALSGGAKWARTIGPIGVRAFATAEDASFANEIAGAAFDPSYGRFEGGGGAGGRLPSGVVWRAAGWAGWHGEVGRYGGGELAISKAWTERFAQDVVIARRLRVPSAQELYQPAIAIVTGGDTVSIAGNADLEPEISDEISLGFRAPHLALSLFGRSEDSRIVLAGGARSVYRSEGSGLVGGARGRFDIGRRLFGVDCSLILAGEGYPEREATAPGVPQYRARVEVGFERRLFKGTELISIGCAAEFAGKRPWGSVELAPYRVLDLNASLTVMSARVRFEMRNLLDERYETVPGFLMPGRYYTIGLFWELFD